MKFVRASQVSAPGGGAACQGLRSLQPGTVLSALERNWGTQTTTNSVLAALSGRFRRVAP